MDPNINFQLRPKQIWWMDVIFYFAMSLLLAAVFCYLIFLAENNLQKSDIKKQAAALLTVGTDQQKAQEKEVLTYQKKINDFSMIFKNHQFASNVFAFMQTQTMPNVWFKQFTFDEKAGSVQLSGEADSVDALSRQISTFEKNKYVKVLGGLNTALGESAKVQFSVNLTLDTKIFSYLSEMSSLFHALPQSNIDQPKEGTVNDKE